MDENEKNPWLATRTRSGADYDSFYVARAKKGIDVHGEANLIEHLLDQYFPDRARNSISLLDAGCGTGRIAIELAQRGYQTIGVDLDAVMLGQAQAKAPDLDWRLDNLATVSLDQRFDAIVMAGNVMIFVTPGSEQQVVANMVAHLRPGGLLIAAYDLGLRPWSDLTLARFDALLDAQEMRLIGRWSTWEQTDWQPSDKYAVSLFQKPSNP